MTNTNETFETNEHLTELDPTPVELGTSTFKAGISKALIEAGEWFDRKVVAPAQLVGESARFVANTLKNKPGAATAATLIPVGIVATACDPTTVESDTLTLEQISANKRKFILEQGIAEQQTLPSRDVSINVTNELVPAGTPLGSTFTIRPKYNVNSSQALDHFNIFLQELRSKGINDVGPEDFNLFIIFTLNNGNRNNILAYSVNMKDLAEGKQPVSGNYSMPTAFAQPHVFVPSPDNTQAPSFPAGESIRITAAYCAVTSRAATIQTGNSALIMSPTDALIGKQ